jgi:hypothetical protein
MTRTGRPRTRPTLRSVAVVALTVTCAAACGVPGDGTTRTIAADKVPYNLLAPAPKSAATPTVTGPAVTTPQIFLVNAEDQLVPHPQPLVASGLSPVVSDLLTQLAAGPTEEERGLGLASALGPDIHLQLIDVVDRVARVEVTSSGPPPAADRLPLAVGQIVLTVTSVDGVDRVQFVRDGADIEAPLPGGARTSEPVSASDYESLLAPSAARAEKVAPVPEPSDAARTP